MIIMIFMNQKCMVVFNVLEAPLPSSLNDFYKTKFYEPKIYDHTDLPTDRATDRATDRLTD